MSTPAIIYLMLTAAGLGVMLVQNGKPKEGRHSFWADVFGSIPAWILLWWGGFFSTNGGC